MGQLDKNIRRANDTVFVRRVENFIMGAGATPDQHVYGSGLTVRSPL